MSIPQLARSNSMDDVREVAPQEVSLHQKDLRDSSKKAAEAVTRSGCAIAQTGVTIGVTASGHPSIAGLTVTGMKAGEEATVACTKGVIESGYCDPALQRTHATVNDCVLL